MNNTVKDVCAELKITQNELAEMLGLHYTTFAKWKDGIPKSSQIALDLLIENHRLKSKLASIVEAVKVIKDLEKI